MHIFRFFEQQNFKLNKKFFLTEQNSHKIISVLRLKVDSKIYLFNNTNIEFTARITSITAIKTIKSKIVEIEILQAVHKNLESPLQIHLAQAVAKNDNMDWIIQKAVELGVYQITPIITNRTIVKITADKTKKLLPHWRSIATSACCQCERNMVPTINPAISFNDLINIYKGSLIDHKFILSPSLDPETLNKLNVNLHITAHPQYTSLLRYVNQWSSTSSNPKLLATNYTGGEQLPLNHATEIILIVGPEGGFSIDELSLAKKHQFKSITIGPRILRTETAPIAAISILQSKYGDL